MAGPLFIAQVSMPDPTSPSDILLIALVVCAVGAVALVAWVLPVVLGIRAALEKRVSPHWMWFGIHPLGGWIAWAVLRFGIPPLVRCPRCARTNPRDARFCPRCGTALASRRA